MLINGEKWACEACVRGHRVSNCQHSDRPLQHINKKGRPVSQCQHCRAMRKSRASHIKCDCGEKTHKCTHLKGTAEGHKESCCCNHGGRCTCTHKKDQPALDTVPESESDQETTPAASCKGGARSRRRANTIHSDGMLTFDENGHHKPTYKHAKASQKSGPYQLGRVNSMNSADCLRNRSADNLFGKPQGSESPGSHGEVVAQEQRRVRSETASPLMTGSSSFSQLNGSLPPLDLSSIDYPPYMPNGFDLYGSLSDQEQPMFSAGLSATSVDWSHYEGLDLASKAADNFAPSSYSQAQSFGGVEFSGSEQVPTLTTAASTSGEVSEADELAPTCGESLDYDSGFRTSTASSGFNLNGLQANLLGSTDLSAIDYEDFLKAGNKFLPTPASLAGEDQTLAAVTSGTSSGFTLTEDDSALWMSDYSHGLSILNDNPDPNMPSFWETQ